MRQRQNSRMRRGGEKKKTHTHTHCTASSQVGPSTGLPPGGSTRWLSHTTPCHATPRHAAGQWPRQRAAHGGGSLTGEGSKVAEATADVGNTDIGAELRQAKEGRGNHFWKRRFQQVWAFPKNSIAPDKHMAFSCTHRTSQRSESHTAWGLLPQIQDVSPSSQWCCFQPCDLPLLSWSPDQPEISNNLTCGVCLASLPQTSYVLKVTQEWAAWSTKVPQTEDLNTAPPADSSASHTDQNKPNWQMLLPRSSGHWATERMVRKVECFSVLSAA